MCHRQWNHCPKWAGNFYFPAPYEDDRHKKPWVWSHLESCTSFLLLAHGFLDCPSTYPHSFATWLVQVWWSAKTTTTASLIFFCSPWWCPPILHPEAMGVFFQSKCPPMYTCWKQHSSAHPWNSEFLYSVEKAFHDVVPVFLSSFSWASFLPFPPSTMFSDSQTLSCRHT